MAAFGIDFGTTTSGAVQILAGAPLTYGDDEGSPMPSIVAIDRATGTAIGGRRTWNERFELEQHGNYFVIPSVKPFLASDRQWPTDARIWTPGDAAAFIFEELNQQARVRGVREGITRATVAIPVGLNATARRVLRSAAAKAGIDIEAFVAESTAAIFRYFEEYKHLHRVVVFDWGGGTLDISVLEFRAGGIFEIGLGGTRTAGNALDHEIAVHLHSRIMEGRKDRRSFDEMDPHDQNQLLFRSEVAKRQLSRAASTPLAMTSYGGEAVHIAVSREMLQPVLAAAVKEAIGLLESTIHKSGLTVDAVDTILLIGGSSQLWLLQEQLSSDSRFKGRYTIAGAPEWDVAHGAALLDREPGAYRIAETLALRLSDGSSIVLARPGDRPNGHRRTLSLVLAEDAAEAHLVIERRADGDTRGKPALQFSAPSLGFLEEEIQFNYGLTPELTFAANAASTRRPAGAVRDYEIEDLRFAYTLETQGI